MQYRNNRGRDPLPQRHQRYMELLDLNKVIEALTDAYEETQNEKVWAVLQHMIAARDNGMSYEEWCRSDESQEFFDNPGAYPWAVQTWMFYYRDQDMQ